MPAFGRESLISTIQSMGQALPFEVFLTEDLAQVGSEAEPQ